jgi:hypothetical protein
VVVVKINITITHAVKCCAITGICMILLLLPAVAHAGDIAIIPWHSGNSSLDTVADETASRITDTVIKLGRYVPLSDIRITEIRKTMQGKAEKGITTKDLNSISGADLTLVINVTQQGPISTGTLDMVWHDGVSQRINVATKGFSLIPLLLDREIISIHGSVPVTGSIKKTSDDGRCVIDIGEYQGIKTGDVYRLEEGGEVKIIAAGRFESAATFNPSTPVNRRFVIKIYPDISERLVSVEKKIHEEIVRRYGSEYTVQRGIPDTEKRFLEGILIINTCGNILIPSYGSLLATNYMGFEKPQPSYPGLFAGAAAELGQLFYIPYRTDMKNWKAYLPISGAGKTGKELRLQRYFWWTLPYTFAVNYCDQLSYQYSNNRILPPLFVQADRNAAILSVFIPGGGYFYKGYGSAAWGWYAAESTLGGYASWHKGRKRKQALLALGGIKAVEVVSAYFLSPSYSFYKDEYERRIEPRIGINLYPEMNRRIALGVQWSVPF